MNSENFNKKQSEMSDTELLKKTNDLLSKLCKTGGKSLTMSVPPSVNDFDMLVCELMKRFEDTKSKELNFAKVKNEIQNRIDRTHKHSEKVKDRVEKAKFESATTSLVLLKMWIDGNFKDGVAQAE